MEKIIKIEPLEGLEGNSLLGKLIRESSRYRVHKIGDKYVGKFSSYERIACLNHEYEVCKDAYESGVSVPKPEGIFSVMHPKEKQIYFAFVMEYINGKTLLEFYKIWKTDITEMWDLAEKENEKLRKINLFNSDARAENIIWNSEKKKIYLIDFGHWKINNVA
jgi:tRNA A-37 threonylcarbamoyl transferase component Bud32